MICSVVLKSVVDRSWGVVEIRCVEDISNSVLWRFPWPGAGWGRHTHPVLRHLFRSSDKTHSDNNVLHFYNSYQHE